MGNFFKVVALLMLALWLPATLHCGLEAAGAAVLTHDSHHSTPCEDFCTDDGCHGVEGVALGKASSTLRVPPPTVALLDCPLHVQRPAAVEESQEFLPDDARPDVQLRHRTWHFVRRAALPARAPDPVA